MSMYFTIGCLVYILTDSFSFQTQFKYYKPQNLHYLCLIDHNLY